MLVRLEPVNGRSGWHLNSVTIMSDPETARRKQMRRSGRVHSYIMENISEELSAEELLKDTKFTVTEVSAKIGYPNYAYFTKLFKKYSGYTPSAYRNCFGRKN